MTWFWAVCSLAPVGIATPILFGIAGGQTRKASWGVAALVYAILSWGGIALAGVTEDDSDGRTIAGLMLLIAWIGGAVHAFVVRPQYARALRGGPSALDRARNAIEERRNAQRLALIEPQTALEMGVGRPDVPGAVHMGVVDVNNAGIVALAELPGLSRALADEIAAARVQIDGFRSLEDLGTVLRLDADTVDDLRPYVVFLPR